jgi:sec-independent protein translocase protein TatB
MFGLSWGQIGIIVVVGAFVLGPERIPTAVGFVTGALRKARAMADGAQAGVRGEIGPELAELRRQIADLQSLAGIAELRDLRDLHPQRLLTTGLFGHETASTPQGLAVDAPQSGSAAQSVSVSQPVSAPQSAEVRGS